MTVMAVAISKTFTLPDSCLYDFSTWTIRGVDPYGTGGHVPQYLDRGDM